MRHVYPNQEIPHLWAHQSQDDARNSTGSLYFEGPTIFSYGAHFPIARHVTNVRGEKAVLFTTVNHSVTTTGHCSAVAHAIPPNVPVFHVPHLRNSWDELPDHADNVESYVRRISELLGKARFAVTRSGRLYSTFWPFCASSRPASQPFLPSGRKIANFFSPSGDSYWRFWKEMVPSARR